MCALSPRSLFAGTGGFGSDGAEVLAGAGEFGSEGTGLGLTCACEANTAAATQQPVQNSDVLSSVLL